jgi:hypothetical protein
MHREPNGFKAVTIEFRRELLGVISKELDRFSTRKAPSDLSELAILLEEPARTLVHTLLSRQQPELIPELATTQIGYSYPLASSITGLDDEGSMKLLERLADYGILLSEPTDSSLACPKCNSLHLHPHILCPGCQTSAQPVELFEHLSCGTISVKITEDQALYCNRCGVRTKDEHEFRIFRGYQCPQCNSSFKHPQMIFVCHACHNITEPENAGITTLKKYVLNPALISELEFLLAKPAQQRIKSSKTSLKTKDIIEEPTPEPIVQDEPEKFPTPMTTAPVAVEATNPAPPASDSLERVMSSNEAQLVEELQQLESALSSGNISEAEYDRKFVRLKLKLRRIRTREML